MTEAPVRRVDAAGLRAAGRQPATPFSVALGDGGGGNDLVLYRLLRVLPGKRIVGEGRWQGRQVLAKLFVSASSARHWAQEKAGIEALRAAGISTPDLLLAAPLATGGHVLLTAYLDGAQSLAEAWDVASALPAGDCAALEVLRPAFTMLGRMHAAGLVQDDLHLGNFLRHDGRLLIIDGDAVRAIAPGQPLDERRAASNFVVLLAQLPSAWDSFRENLLAAYRAGGGTLISDTAWLERELSRVRDWRLNDYLNKTGRDCTLFAVEHSAFRFTAVQRDQRDRLAPLLESPDAAILGGVLLKDGRTCTVARVEQAGCAFVIKRYNLKNFRHRLERFWRPSRAWHSWRAGHLLHFFDIPTPAPLAVVEERVGPLRRRAFLINAYCPGSNLLQYLQADGEPGAEAADAIVALFRALHDLRISHGDLKATNLLWHEGRVFVIDLDAMVRHRSASSHAAAWRRDRARLLRNWPVSSVLHAWLDRNLPPASV